MPLAVRFGAGNKCTLVLTFLTKEKAVRQYHVEITTLHGQKSQLVAETAANPNSGFSLS
jgi:hypothetical protein